MKTAERKDQKQYYKKETLLRSSKCSQTDWFEKEVITGYEIVKQIGTVLMSRRKHVIKEADKFGYGLTEEDVGDINTHYMDLMLRHPDIKANASKVISVLNGR